MLRQEVQVLRRRKVVSGSGFDCCGGDEARRQSSLSWRGGLCRSALGCPAQELGRPGPSSDYQVPVLFPLYLSQPQTCSKAMT